MNTFDDFANIEELFRSLSYKDLVHLCQTNQKFREICNSPRGKRLIDDALISALEQVDVIDVLEKLINKDKFGRTHATLKRLKSEYLELITDAIVDILIKNNYSAEFYDKALNYFMNHSRGWNSSNRIETRYTPEINNLLTAIYRHGLEPDWILRVIDIYDRKNYTDIDVNKVNRIFFKRHPESLSYFRNTLFK